METSYLVNSSHINMIEVGCFNFPTIISSKLYSVLLHMKPGVSQSATEVFFTNFRQSQEKSSPPFPAWILK